jgi:undecaprenyl-diphosphatase
MDARTAPPAATLAMKIDKDADGRMYQSTNQPSLPETGAHENVQSQDLQQPDFTPRRRATRRLLCAEVWYSVALVLFAVLAAFAHLYSYFGWDLRVARTLQSLHAPGFAELMRFVSLFGNSLTPHVLTLIAILLFLFFRRRSEAAALLLSAGGGAIMTSLLKLLVARPRPTADLVRIYRDVSSQSFPSGHVTFYVCFFGFLFFTAYALLPRYSLARRAALTASFLPVLLVGFSRVYLGAHWPSDTLGAYLISGVWLAFSLHLYRRWKERATFHAMSGYDVRRAE